MNGSTHSGISCSDGVCVCVYGVCVMVCVCMVCVCMVCVCVCLWSVTCATGYTLGRMHFDIADTDREILLTRCIYM